MGGSHVRSKHRNTGRTAQSAICDHVLERRSHVGAQRCRTRLEHRDLRAIRESGQSRLDQVLLDWGYPPTFTPDIHSLRCHQVDV